MVLDEVDDPQVVLVEMLDNLVVVAPGWCSTRWVTLRWSWGSWPDRPGDPQVVLGEVLDEVGWVVLRWSWGRCWMGWVVTFRCPLDGLDGLDG